MASDLTPEEIAGIRAIAEEAGPLESVCAVFGDEESLFALLDMAERCAKAEADAAKLRERLEQAERREQDDLDEIAVAIYRRLNDNAQEKA